MPQVDVGAERLPFLRRLRGHVLSDQIADPEGQVSPLVSRLEGLLSSGRRHQAPQVFPLCLRGLHAPLYASPALPVDARKGRGGELLRTRRGRLALLRGLREHRVEGREFLLVVSAAGTHLSRELRELPGSFAPCILARLEYIFEVLFFGERFLPGHRLAVPRGNSADQCPLRPGRTSFLRLVGTTEGLENLGFFGLHKAGLDSCIKSWL